MVEKKTLFEFHYFTFPTGDGTAILRDHLRATRRASRLQRKGGIPSFHSYFETLSIVPASGVEPATSRSAVKRATD